MKRRSRIAAILAGAGAAVLLATGAQAGTTISAARVGAVDANALAEFYEAAFGLQETNRFQTPSGVEIILAPADANAKGTAQLFVNHRASDAVKDPVPHVILHVDDLATTIKAIKASGGSIEREPFLFGNVITIAIARDPVGNLVELFQVTGAPR